MNTNTPAPEQVYGYGVHDSQGNKIGDVDGVWVDDATSALEFVGVKTGFIMGKTHLIPAENAEFGDKTLKIPFSKDQVHNAPSFGTDAELSPEDENQIYSHYGLDRSTSPSPTGLADSSDYSGTGYNESQTASGIAGSEGDYATSGRGNVSADTRDVILSEEQLQVGKREVESGRVRLRKVVRSETVTEPIELRHEEVQIERVDASGTEVPANAFEEQQIDVPVMNEEAVVGKEAHVTGRVHVGKDVQTETRNIDGEIRREDVEVDRDGVASGSGFDRSSETRSAEGTRTSGNNFGDRNR